jgi:glycopeptide antibiotics resistance protein
MLWKEKFKSIAYITGFGLIVSLSIEILQYAEGILLPSVYTRASDINDLIFNTVGVLIGYLVYKLFVLDTKFSRDIT